VPLSSVGGDERRDSDAGTGKAAGACHGNSEEHNKVTSRGKGGLRTNKEAQEKKNTTLHARHELALTSEDGQRQRTEWLSPRESVCVWVCWPGANVDTRKEDEPLPFGGRGTRVASNVADLLLPVRENAVYCIFFPALKQLRGAGRRHHFPMEVASRPDNREEHAQQLPPTCQPSILGDISHTSIHHYILTRFSAV